MVSGNGSSRVVPGPFGDEIHESMMALYVPILLTFVGLLALSQLMGRRKEFEPSHTLELRWVVSAGMVFGALTTWILSAQYVTGPACAPDFFEYCQALLFLDGDHPVFPDKRSRFAAILPYFYSTQFGILDGLAMAGVVCACITGSALFLWARLLGGRTAGILCLGFAASMAPLAAMPRFLAFYPEISAGLCLAAAATVAAILSPSWTRLSLAGAGIGVCLLLDVRSLLWALPYLAATAFTAVIHTGSLRTRTLRVFVLLLPIVASYLAGGHAFGPEANSLEEQIDIRPLFHGEWVKQGQAIPKEFEPPHSLNTAYVWGRSSPLEIPSTIQFIWEQRSLESSVTSPLPSPSSTSLERHDNWTGVSWMGWFVCLAVLIRKPKAMLALAVSVFPFWMSLRSIGGMAEDSARFYIHALPGTAILLAVGMGAAIQQIPRWTGLKMPQWARATVLCSLLLAMLLSWIPSWMAPDATWRSPLTCWDRPLIRDLPEANTATTTVSRPQEAECAEAVYQIGDGTELPLRTFNGL